MAAVRLFFLLCCAVVATAQEASSPLEAHLAAAREAQAHANCHLAAQEYRAAAALMPGSGELRTNEAIALYCDQQFGAAVTAFETALRLNPALTTPHLFLGLASYRLGDLPMAEKQLKLYLAKSSNDATGHLWLGYTLAAQRQPAAAETQFNQVLERDPRNLDALYAKGQAALEIAHAKATELDTLDPGGVALLQLAAAKYRRGGDSQRAAAAEQESAKRLAERPHEDADHAKTEALLQQETQAAQTDAQDTFAAILRLAPESYRAHEILGDALLAAQQQDAAIREYEEVIRLNPSLPGVHETLSRCLMIAGRFADALAALRAEIALSPSLSSRLLTRVGQAQDAMGDDAAAAASLRDAMRDPDVPSQAYLLLAEVLLRQGQPRDAVPLLKRYLTFNPDASTAFYYLSRAYRMLGERTAMAQALEDYKRTSQDARERALLAPVLRGAPGSTFSESTPGGMTPETSSPPAQPEGSPHRSRLETNPSTLGSSHVTPT